jgi:restriction endonuclease Mrr
MGAKQLVTPFVIQQMTARGFIGDAELEEVSNGETRAANTVAWARNSLKDRGLIERDTPRGMWHLTAAGEQLAEEINLPTQA